MQQQQQLETFDNASISSLPSTTSTLTDILDDSMLFSPSLLTQEIQVISTGHAQSIDSKHSTATTTANSTLVEKQETNDTEAVDSAKTAANTINVEKRNQAFQVFKKLENLYKQVYTRVIDEKERDLLKLEQDIRNGTHKQLLRDLQGLSDARDKLINVAKNRRNLAMESINAEYENNLHQLHVGSCSQKSSLRRFFSCANMRDQLKLAHEIGESDRIRNGKWTRNDPKFYPPGRKIRTVPYPILEQYHWRRRHSFIALETYRAKVDFFGSNVPPRQAPVGLHSTEIEQDLFLLSSKTVDKVENIET